MGTAFNFLRQDGHAKIISSGYVFNLTSSGQDKTVDPRFWHNLEDKKAQANAYGDQLFI